MISFRNILEDGLKELGVEIIAESAERSPSTTFIRLPISGTSMQTLLLLEQKKYLCWIGFGLWLYLYRSIYYNE